MACSCAARRERMAVMVPAALYDSVLTVKQVCFPTLDIAEIFLVDPLTHGAITSSRFMCAERLPKRKCKV